MISVRSLHSPDVFVGVSLALVHQMVGIVLSVTIGKEGCTTNCDIY